MEFCLNSSTEFQPVEFTHISLLDTFFLQNRPKEKLWRSSCAKTHDKIIQLYRIFWDITEICSGLWKNIHFKFMRNWSKPPKPGIRQLDMKWINWYTIGSNECPILWYCIESIYIWCSRFWAVSVWITAVPSLFFFQLKNIFLSFL